MKDFFIKNISNNIHKPISLWSGLGMVIIFLAGVNSFFSDLFRDLFGCGMPIANPSSDSQLFIEQQKCVFTADWIRFILYGLLILSWVVFWLVYKYKYPKKKKDRIGLVIAIYAENNHEEIRLKNDFVCLLQKNISQEGFADLMDIIVLKNHLSEKIKTPDDVHKLAKKTKGHFFLYGDVKRRQDGDSKYFLSLEGLVIHRPINIFLSDALKRDFISVLPKEISFSETFEFKGFSFTADIVYLCVRYITGLAAYLSGDAWLAIKLHNNLRQEFNKFKPLPLHLQNIRNKVPVILSNEKVALARYYFLKGDLASSVNFLNESLNDNNQNYSAWLLKAIQDFKINNNPDEALKSTKKAEDYSGGRGEWRYSKAFLLFWQGKYKDALSQCGKISKGGYVGEEITLRDVEIFNLDLLKNQKKPQLYFWLGYINYRKSQNYPKALEYLEKFESESDSSMNELKQKSSAYLIEIKKQMNL